MIVRANFAPWRPGFTLVELVIALTIAGLATIAGSSALSTLIDRQQHARTSLETLTGDVLLRQSLRDLIGGAAVTRHDDSSPFRGLDARQGPFADDELTFSSFAHSPFAPDGATLRLFIERRVEAPERGLMLGVTDAKGSSRIVLLDRRIQGLDISYLSSAGSTSVWSPSWVSASLLPLAVAIRVEAPATDTLPPLLRLPIVVPLRIAR